MFTFKKINIELISWLFILIPISFIFGSFFINSITTTIVILYLIFFFKDHLLRINNSCLFFIKFFFSFNLYLFISAILGETPLDSIFSSLSYLRYVFLILAISFILEKNFNYFKYFFYISFITLIVLFYDLLIQLIYNQNLVGFINISSDRYTGFFGKEQILGSFVVRFLPLILFLVNLIYFKKNNYFLQILIIFLAFFLTLVSGERTAFLMFFIYIFFFIVINKNLKLMAILIFLFISLSSLIILLKQPLKSRFVDATLNQLTTKQDTDSNFSFLSIRHENHIKTAINIFKKNIIFGSGPNSFRHICFKKEYSVADQILDNSKVRSKFNGYLRLDIKTDNSEFFEKNPLNPTVATITGSIADANNNILEQFIIPENSKITVQNNSFVFQEQVIYIKHIPYENGCNTHPHNYIFQILAELGLFGMGFFLFFLYNLYLAIFKNIYYIYSKKKKYSKNILILLLGLLINFFPFMPTGGFFNSWLTTICLLPVAFLFYLKNNNINK